jgi:hypothetical protein
MATNPKLRATVFLMGPSEGGLQQAAEWCLDVDEWLDVVLKHPKMGADYIGASSVPAIALHSSNFTDGMVLKTLHPAFKLVLGKKIM